jgi:hypothetical protein
MTTPPLPEQIELHRDRRWRRDEDLRIESAVDAERFIEDVGFANTLTDARRAGPSLYIAVWGRRDVSLPRNVQRSAAPAVESGLEIVLRRERFCKSVGLVFDGFYVERLVNCLLCCGYLVFSFLCGRQKVGPLVAHHAHIW